MKTRWKQFVRNTWTKAGAFVLAVVLSGTAIGTMEAASEYSGKNNLTWDILADHNAWINTVLTEEYNAAMFMTDMVYSFGGEQNVMNGKSITDTQIVERLYEDYYMAGETSGQSKDRLSKQTKRNIEREMYAYLGADGDTDEISGDVQSFMNWLDTNPGCYEEARKSLINENINSWNREVDSLASLGDNYVYCVYTKRGGGETLETNVTVDETKSKREQAKAARQKIGTCAVVLSLDPKDGTFAYQWDERLAEDAMKTADTSDAASLMEDFDDPDVGISDVRSSDVIVVGVRDKTFNEYMGTDYNELLRPLEGYAMAFGLCLMGVLLCIIVLICGVGRTNKDDTARLRPEDRIWSEIYWMVGLGGFALCAAFGLQWMDLMQSAVTPTSPLRVMPVLCAMAGAAIGLLCLMPQVRRIKTHTFWHGFICLRGAKYVLDRWKRGPLFMKVISAAILVPLVCMPLVTIPFVIAGLLYAGIRFAERLKAVGDGAKRIRAGETDTQIEVKGGQELKQLADDLNSISDGLHSAVETAVQSERLKSELISNVSHDLKTPLTGIITYVDLMKKLEPNDPRMAEYLQTVDQKTKRLSVLINDLLEASKASSGAMKTDLSRVDWEALFQQTCGEMEGKLHAAGLEIRLRTEGRTEVIADGRKLWRIMDNLLTNCVRYALPNSRIYVELKEQGSWCVLTMKNISAQELNISAEELMERFTRGDRARYTEGSGLGLSIARSLAELMHGSFNITVDGDLFKAEVFMPLWTGNGRTAQEKK